METPTNLNRVSLDVKVQGHETQTVGEVYIECGILGKWCVMVSGNTYPAREVLKQFGFRWVPEWKMWMLMFRYKREWEAWIRKYLRELMSKLNEYGRVNARGSCMEITGEQKT